jgi:GNAT superfamily N-acetyltransferase
MNKKLAQIIGFKNRLPAVHNGLKVVWFDGWHPVLEEALRELPEMETCPHELFHLLIQNPGSLRKRSALVTERGTPVAVIGLRQIGRFSWEPVTQWIVPGSPFPARPGYIMASLEALETDVWVAWWRMGDLPQQGSMTRFLESAPTYRIHLSADYEQYWRQNGNFKNIRNVRNRCRDFTLAINSTGAAEWVIKNWDSKWRSNQVNNNPTLSDRILAVNYLENLGKHYTLLLLDQDKPIGGTTNTVHCHDLVAGVLYRNPEYDRQGVGTYLLDLVVSFAAEKGFATMDLGGGHNYKQKWAPPEGMRWQLNICPEHIFRTKQIINWVSGIRKQLIGGKGDNQKSMD